MRKLSLSASRRRSLFQGGALGGVFALLAAGAGLGLWCTEQAGATSVSPSPSAGVTTSVTNTVTNIPSPSVTAQLPAPAPAAAPPRDDKAMQKQQYQDAIDAAEDGKQGNEISAGVWGLTSILCGYNCYQYLGPLSTAQAGMVSFMTQAYKSAGILSSCGTYAPQAEAAAVTLIEHLTSCETLLSTDASTKIGATQGMGAVAAAPATMISGAAVEHAFKTTCIAPIQADLTAAQAAADSGIAEEAAAVVVGVGAATHFCKAASASLATDQAAVVPAVTAYMTASAAVMTTGWFCSGAAVASAATDLVLSRNMAGDTSEGYMSLIGATPAVISSAIILLKLGGASMSHNASGISSCITSGVGLAVIAQKVSLAQDYQDIIDENTQRRDNLAYISPLGWKRIFSDAGIFLDSMLGGCALAATSVADAPDRIPQLAAECRKSVRTQSQTLSCAQTRDAAISRILKEDPKRLPEMMAHFEKIFGAETLQKVLANPFDRKLAASLIAKDKPSLAPKLADYFETLPAKFRKGGLKAPSVGKVAAIQQPTLGSAFQTAPADTAPAQGMEAPDVAREPAKAQAFDSTTGLYSAESSLFDNVSKRYQAVKDRVTKKDWEAPFNKFSAGGE